MPPDTTLVFDLVLLDVFNRADQVQTKVISTPKDCKRSVMRTDFVRFHFNGTLLDGTVFDSRLVLLSVPVDGTAKNNDCFRTGFLNASVPNSHSSHFLSVTTCFRMFKEYSEVTFPLCLQNDKIELSLRCLHNI